MLYQVLKRSAGIFFNFLNILLGGNLPPFGSVCVIVEREHHFLVVEQRNGTMVFPGGFMRWSELPEQTVIREGKEETGLQLHPTRIIGHYPKPTKCIDSMSVIHIAYQAEVISGELRKSIEGQPSWVNEEDLLDKLSPYYLTIFQDYLRHREQQDESSIHKA
ncbi:MAG TPA: NUDIX hydrolase [Ktedonobacteraceae bacterium]|jgi:ADP-ribose pyrophosphatase YjhB (NUDIX family)